MLTLEGRTAIVTGGASGIGLAAIRALQDQGTRVASLDLTTGSPADVEVFCDVSDEQSVEGAVKQAVGELGGLDYAFCNAGIYTSGSVLGLTASEWDRVVGVNLRGVFLTLQQTARVMKDSGTGGAIVCTSSTAAFTVDLALVHYSVAKMGVQQLVRAAARELGPFGIRVNAVAPGPTNTPMFAPGKGIPDFCDSLVRNTPLGRLGETDDIIEAVLALFALRWVTGQTLVADGGITLLSGTDFPGLTPQALARSKRASSDR